MKNIFLLTIIAMTSFSCSKEPNDFSDQANVFLDSIDNKDYDGVNSAVGSDFKVNGKLIAEFSETGPTIALEFQNTLGDGTSSTDGIYRQARDPRLWIGIHVENGGATLQRTALASTLETIDWSVLETFAQQK